MNPDRNQPPAPPRLLLGAALLFWGAMVEQPFIGLLCALLVEGRWWVRLRWGFSEAAFVRAWWISLFLVILAFALQWMGGNSSASVYVVLRWLPLFFLPLIFVQQYALTRAFPLNSFSMVARRKMVRDRQEGRPVDPVLIHFGYIYFGLILMAASFGESRSIHFFVGLTLFAGAALFCASGCGRQRLWAWVSALVVAAVLGFSGSLGMQRLYDYVVSGSWITRGPSGEVTSTAITAIGKVGRLKLSHDIRWRMRVEEGGAPLLLREAIYNNYSGGIWGYTPPAGRSKREDADEMAQRGDEDDRFVFDREDFDIDERGAAHVVVTGAVRSRDYRVPLPLPAGARLIDNLQVDGVSFTSLGTTRAENLDFSVLQFDIYHERESRSEGDPYLRYDLVIPGDPANPEGVRTAVKKVVDDLGLRNLPPRAALARLRRFFAEEFEYTLYQQLPRWVRRHPDRALTYFLNEQRRGHCEYFATAAVLILREAGIPARYATGYAAKEQSRSGEWLLRGQHGHAWCRVYLGGERGIEVVEDPAGGAGEEYVRWQGGQWIDFDPTPANWLAMEGSGVPWEQHFFDWWGIMRQEVLLWRTREGVRSKVTWGMAVVGVLLSVFIVVRLWKGLVVQKGRGRRSAGAGVRIDRKNPLARLVRPGEKILGPRPPGQPLSTWLLGLCARRPALAGPLEQAVSLYWKGRYDSLGLAPKEKEKLAELCREIRRQL